MAVSYLWNALLLGNANTLALGECVWFACETHSVGGRPKGGRMRSFRSYAPGQNSPASREKSFLPIYNMCILKKKPDSLLLLTGSEWRVEKRQESFSLELHVCVFYNTRERAAHGILSHVCAAHFAGIVRFCLSDFSPRCTRCIVFSRRSRARGRCRCSYFSSQTDECNHLGFFLIHTANYLISWFFVLRPQECASKVKVNFYLDSVTPWKFTIHLIVANTFCFVSIIFTFWCSRQMKYNLHVSHFDCFNN